MFPVSMIVVGAGQRGAGYARWARQHPQRASVVAVAEPDDARRARLAAEHGIAARNVAADWKQLAGRGRLADAVLICTQDRMHAEPVEAFAALGYHILLEKPMAPDEAGCRRIVAAVEQAGVMLAVGHVLRYTPYTRAVKEIVGSGRLGDIMSVQHLEPVGFWHHAHSYVRGNWRRADLGASMLLAKSCHDLDWLQYILDRAPLRVSSFGSRAHFTATERPEGAADRCTRAELTGDGRTIRVHDFRASSDQLITPVPADTADAFEGHGGGDSGLMDAFTTAVATGDRTLIKSGPCESLASHLAVFAAERARLNGTVETIPP